MLKVTVEKGRDFISGGDSNDKRPPHVIVGGTGNSLLAANAVDSHKLGGKYPQNKIVPVTYPSKTTVHPVWHPELGRQPDDDEPGGILSCCEHLEENVDEVVDVPTLLNAHYRQRHLNFTELRQLLGLAPESSSFPNPLCFGCQHVKPRRVQHNHEKGVGREKVPPPRPLTPIEHLWMDLVKLQWPCLTGETVAQLVVDGTSRKSWIQFLMNKPDLEQKLLSLVATLENEKFPNRVKMCWSDAEPIYAAVGAVLKKIGIQHKMSPPGRHDKNGVPERKVQTIFWNAFACMVVGGSPPSTDFKHALIHMNYVSNHTPTSANPDKLTPEEVYLGRRLPKSKLLAQGIMFQRCLFKMNEDWVPGIFLGISESHQAYTIRSMRSNRLIHSVTIKFENEFPYRGANPQAALRNGAFNQKFPDKDREIAIALSQPLALMPPGEAKVGGEEVKAQEQPLRQSARGFIPSEAYKQNLLQTGELGGGFVPSGDQLDQMAQLNVGMGPGKTLRPKDPANLEEAQQNQEEFNEFWMPAMLKEYEKHMERETCEVILRSEVPNGSKIYKPRMVFTRKYSEPDQEHPLGELIGPKVRMTIAAHTSTLKEGVDYSQSYTPTVRDASIRVLLSVVAKEDFELCKIDIETFFLWGDLEEADSTPVFMEVPPYFPVPSHLKGKDVVMRVLKSIYGMPQASFCSHKKLKRTLLTNKSIRCLEYIDSCVFILYDKDGKLKAILADHVDDMLAGGTPKAITELLETVGSVFKITHVMNPASYLSLQIERDRPNRWLKISQKVYTQKKLAEFQMDKATPAKIPMDPSVRNTIVAVEGETYNDTANKEKRHVVYGTTSPAIKEEYLKIVGSLMFMKTREDLAFSVNFLARSLQNPTSQHLVWAKQVLRYLAGTVDKGAVFQSKSPLILHGFFDSDLAGDVYSGRSTIGVTIRLGDCGTILFYSRLGRKPADSTAMAETYAGVSAAKDIIWLRTLLIALGYPQDNPTVLRGDNQVMIEQCTKNLNHYDSRHYRIAQAMLYNFAQEKVIEFVKIPSSENRADPHSKPLPIIPFEAHMKSNMGPQQSR